MVFEPSAEDALADIVTYIVEDAGRDRATRWLRSLLEATDALDTLPKAFRAWTTDNGREIYSKLVSPHRVFYFVDDITLTVHIIDVVHTARESVLARYRE